MIVRRPSSNPAHSSLLRTSRSGHLHWAGHPGRKTTVPSAAIRPDNFTPANHQVSFPVESGLVRLPAVHRAPVSRGISTRRSASRPNGVSPPPRVFMRTFRKFSSPHRLEVSLAIFGSGCTMTSFSFAHFIEKEAFIWTEDRS